MDASKLQLKIFTAPGKTFASEAFIPVFHRWIKDRVLPELLIDVANYAHVPNGPGVVLIGHASDYFIDEGEGRQGLLYSRKRQTPASAVRLEDTFRRTLHAATLLEAEPSLNGLRFSTSELLFRINDRLGAPNTRATFELVQPELAGLCDRVFGKSAYTLAPAGEIRQLFGVTIKVTDPAPVSALLGRVGGPL